LSFVLFLGVLGACVYALIRFRKAPNVYWLTAGLIVLALIWNQYAANSCEGGCDIRVDLLLILPIVAIALLLSIIALLKRQ
jgi:hypothetical protein